MKTFVINLEDRKDRIKKFKHLNDDVISYEIFNAINGYSISHTKLLRDGFDIDNNWMDPISNTKLTKGEVGCFLSHWKIWEECVRLNEPVLILEDDANFYLSNIEFHHLTIHYQSHLHIPVMEKMVQN